MKEGQPNESSPPPLDMIVEALRQGFGDRALDVARRQSALAGAESAAVWQAIVDRLDR